MRRVTRELIRRLIVAKERSSRVENGDRIDVRI
jgi:hypothetical protein